MKAFFINSLICLISLFTIKSTHANDLKEPMKTFNINKKSIQIIYLNGPSSSGKTTLAKALQNKLEIPYFYISFDRMCGMLPSTVNNWDGGPAILGFSWKASNDDQGFTTQELQFGPYAKRIMKTFKEIVFSLAKDNYSIIIEDVAFGKKEVDEWRKTLKDFNVLWVGVKTSLDVLEKREKERGNRIIGGSRDQYHRVHSGVSYDIEIDTSQTSPEKCADKIKDYIFNSEKTITQNTSNQIVEQYSKKIEKNLL